MRDRTPLGPQQHPKPHTHIKEDLSAYKHRETLNELELRAEVSLLREALYYKTLELQDALLESEVANRKCHEYEQIAIDLGRSLRQVSQWSQSNRNGGTI